MIDVDNPYQSISLSFNWSILTVDKECSVTFYHLPSIACNIMCNQVVPGITWLRIFPISECSSQWK